jgi:hypothetical protein
MIVLNFCVREFDHIFILHFVNCYSKDKNQFNNCYVLNMKAVVNGRAKWSSFAKP